MLFMISLEHTPEQCFGREEYKEEMKQWAGEMRSSAEKLGIKINGAYVCPNEHIFYFILESDSLKAISEFFKPPMLTHHTGKISPIMTIEEATEGTSLLEK
ncbi:hypothetical protein SAMN04488587_0548 [Methanococcoides vulcani]|uniref:GYD domain-containing protein n=1 Tax=Methanococcoides vulcani TaxID=1353158 RepID=A0A1H9YHQ7_9EURY|nr:DUF3303 family protein [Methanococcoides vulcani]SES68116.1 hypothetical protein SAMN04488587_0548 [Methanococcoides vulcani]